MHKQPSRLFRSLILGAAVLCSFTSAALAQEKEIIDLKKGPWSRLVEYVGTNNYDAVLDDKDVKKATDKLLKGHDVDLKTAFQVQTPIKYEGECLALSGNPQSQADTNRAYMEVCVGGSVNLAVYNNGKVTVYATSNNYEYLTDGMRSWIYFQSKDIDLFAAPKDVQFVVQAQ